MLTMLALVGALLAVLAAPTDPVRDAILQSLASYAGITALVVAVISGAKHLWPAWVGGKEPGLCVILSFGLGITAKLSLPEVYGGGDAKSWAVHLIALLVVAILGKGAHDGIINAFKPSSNGSPSNP